MLTAQQLIEILQRFPPDTPVLKSEPFLNKVYFECPVSMAYEFIVRPGPLMPVEGGEPIPTFADAWLQEAGNFTAIVL